MEQPDFQFLILQLAEARRLEESLKEKHADILLEVKTAVSNANVLEEKLRKTTEEWFLETGERLPHDAVKIVVEERVEIDPEINRLLAFDEDPTLLVLDMKQLKTFMKEGKASWVKTQIIKKATPHIRSDLNEYLITQHIISGQQELLLA